MSTWWIVFIIVPMVLILIGFLFSLFRGNNYHPYWGRRKSCNRCGAPSNVSSPVYTVNTNTTNVPTTINPNPTLNNPATHPSSDNFTPQGSPPLPPPPPNSNWQSQELYPPPPPYTEFENQKMFY